MNVEVYGDPNPPADAHPNVRVNTVLVWKKHISSFMPDRGTAWNATARSGNPTRSNVINELIARMKKKQVRRHQQQQGPLQQQPTFPVGGHLESRTTRELLLTMANQITSLQASLQAELSDIAEARQAHNAAMMAQFRIANTHLRRIASQSIRPVHLVAAQQNNNNNQNGGDNRNVDGGGDSAAHSLLRAELSPTPRNVYILWDEYMHGIGGRKPACQFTREERGRVKHKYCRRKVVWDRIVFLVNAGLTHQVACDRIHDVYGHSTSVTMICDRLKQDTKNSTLHETLRMR